MAVDKHPSRMPGAPRRPPATSTTAGTINKIPANSGSGQEGVEYGFRHEINVKPPHKSERHYDFNEGMSMGSSSEGRAPRAGKEQPQEGPKKGERAAPVGDQKKSGEPG